VAVAPNTAGLNQAETDSIRRRSSGGSPRTRDEAHAYCAVPAWSAQSRIRWTSTVRGGLPGSQSGSAPAYLTQYLLQPLSSPPELVLFIDQQLFELVTSSEVVFPHELSVEQGKVCADDVVHVALRPPGATGRALCAHRGMKGKAGARLAISDAPVLDPHGNRARRIPDLEPCCATTNISRLSLT
jgi:hypothetical protein